MQAWQAAAPEMLAALKAISQHMPMSLPGTEYEDETDEAQCMMRAAIAKAEGHAAEKENSNER